MATNAPPAPSSSSPGHRPPAPRRALIPASAWLAGREVALVVTAWLTYFGVRVLTEGSDDTATANADSLMRFERDVGVFHEHALQQFAVDHSWLLTLANWVYIW